MSAGFVLILNKCKLNAILLTYWTISQIRTCVLDHWSYWIITIDALYNGSGKYWGNFIASYAQCTY